MQDLLLITTMKNEVERTTNLMNSLQSEAIVEAIGYGVSLQDKDFRIMYQNKLSTKIMGSHVGELCYEAFEHNDSVCTKCPLSLSFRDGKVHFVERANPYGKGLCIEITSSVIRNPQGGIIAGMVMLRNITRRKRLEKEQAKMVLELKHALHTVKTPKGFLPICASCHKVRDYNNRWTSVDVYIRDHSDAEITHGYCPDCAKKYFATDDKSVY